MRKRHPIQIKILKKLLFNPSLKFSEAKPSGEIENNKFAFHLSALIDEGLIGKEKDNYFLTIKGKEYANRMDTEEEVIEFQAKLSVWVIPIRENLKIEREYLIYTRLKHPFYGSQGFLAGKILYGEKVLDAAKREMREETDLIGVPELVSVRHYRVYDKASGRLVEDKFMFLCQVINPRGIIDGNEEGLYEWVKESNLNEYVTNHFEGDDGFQRDIKLLNDFNGGVIFEEYDMYTEKF